LANCFKCPHQREVDRLEKERKRLEAICRNCIIKNHDCGLSHGGVSFVSSDSVPNPDIVYKGRIARDWQAPNAPNVQPKIESPLNQDERSNLLMLLNKFAELGSSYDDAGLICSMLAGKTIDQIAQERKISEQALHARWKKICKRDSTWESLANGLIGKGVGRKANKNLKQGELGL
jgi:hypothetical protein